MNLRFLVRINIESNLAQRQKISIQKKSDYLIIQ